MRLFFLFFIGLGLYAAELHFDTFKKSGSKPGDTLLIIGGIHGDEPGSYFTASLVAQYYTINKGNVWVVPNLNFDSIVRNKRGIYGDMNRKFASLDPNDKDYEIVSKIKKLITDEEVDLILNLHDGHGFYRPKWESSIFNPAAWGQATIIDQKVAPQLKKYSELDKIAQEVVKILNNGYLEQNYHRFGVKNTDTKYKDEQQQLSLTYFAINNGKAAFAIEASKNIESLPLKVFYHLQAIEAYMKIMGIEFSRDFELTPDEVKQRVYNYGKVIINDSIELDLNNVKRVLRYVPLPKTGTTIKSDNPLVAFLPHKTANASLFKINVGHLTAVYLYPDYFEIDNSLKEVKIIVDGEEKSVKIPSSFEYTRNFKVKAPPGYRVNVIGFTKVKGNQNNALVHTKDIPKRFALNPDENHFRIEIYKDSAFVGMVIAKDVSNKQQSNKR